MRVRTPKSSNTTNTNGRTPTKQIQASPIKPRPAKVFDTRAEIREDITSATLAQQLLAAWGGPNRVTFYTLFKNSRSLRFFLRLELGRTVEWIKSQLLQVPPARKLSYIAINTKIETTSNEQLSLWREAQSLSTLL